MKGPGTQSREPAWHFREQPPKGTLSSSQRFYGSGFWVSLALRVTLLRVSSLFLAALGLCHCTGFFSSCSEQVLPRLWRACFSLWWLLLLKSTGSWLEGFSSCGSPAPGSRAQAQ